MNNFNAYQRLQRVENAFKLAEKLPPDDELILHFTRYLCLLCSGYIETSLRIILSDYASMTAKTTANYVSWQLKRVQNPKVEVIAQLISAFDETWKDSFLLAIEGAPSAGINSIVANRNRIAHGENINISLGDLKIYFADARKVIDLIDAKFHSPGSS